MSDEETLDPEEETEKVSKESAPGDDEVEETPEA